MNDTPLFEKYKDIYNIFTLITKAGLFDKEKDLTNEYFHHPDKGCQLEYVGSKSRQDDRIYKHQRCLTHNVDVCLCGWQKGYHYGTCSYKLPKSQKKLKDYNRGICSKKDCNKPVLALGLCSQHYAIYNRKKKNI